MHKDTFTTYTNAYNLALPKSKKRPGDQSPTSQRSICETGFEKVKTTKNSVTKKRSQQKITQLEKRLLIQQQEDAFKKQIRKVFKDLEIQD